MHKDCLNKLNTLFLESIFTMAEEENPAYFS